MDMPTKDVFQALADPTRRRILKMLTSGREMTAGQISDGFHISGPSMSHHFNILKQADLLTSRREGQQILYSLNTTVVEDVITALLDVFAKSKGRNGRKS